MDELPPPPSLREWIKPMIAGVVVLAVLLFLGLVLYAVVQPTTIVR